MRDADKTYAHNADQQEECNLYVGVCAFVVACNTLLNLCGTELISVARTTGKAVTKILKDGSQPHSCTYGSLRQQLDTRVTQEIRG